MKNKTGVVLVNLFFNLAGELITLQSTLTHRHDIPSIFPFYSPELIAKLVDIAKKNDGLWMFMVDICRYNEVVYGSYKHYKPTNRTGGRTFSIAPFLCLAGFHDGIPPYQTPPSVPNM